MSKARNAAISELGKEDDYINLKGFNTERTNLQNTYNTDYNNLQNAYNNLLSTAEQNKISAGKDFVSNRNVVDASDYMATRGRTGADLSSRGLSKGFGSAGRFATNLQRNQANSNIANTYYNAMADIQKDIDVGTQTHNYNMESLKNQLDKGLADVAAREAAARNAYRAQVAQLAEQIQSRWDSNANAQASINAAKASLDYQKQTDLYKNISAILGDNPKKITLDKVNQAKALYENMTGDKGYGNALNYLYSKGLLTKDIYLPLVSSPYKRPVDTSTLTSPTNIPLPTQRPTSSKPSGLIPSPLLDDRG